LNNSKKIEYLAAIAQTEKTTDKGIITLYNFNPITRNFSNPKSFNTGKNPVSIDSSIILDGNSVVATANFKGRNVTAYKLAPISSQIQLAYPSKDAVVNPSLATQIIGRTQPNQVVSLIQNMGQFSKDPKAISDVITGIFEKEEEQVPLPDGTYTIIASLQNDPSIRTENTFTVRADAPLLFIDSPISEDRLNNIKRIRGEARLNKNSQHKVIIFIDDVQQAFEPKIVHGKWEFPLQNQLSNGAHTITAQIMSKSGSVAARESVYFKIRNDASSLFYKINLGTIKDQHANLHVRGITTPTNAVYFFINGKIIGHTFADQSGRWNFIANVKIFPNNRQFFSVASIKKGTAKDPQNLAIRSRELRIPTFQCISPSDSLTNAIVAKYGA
jgi:hypothetical protein